MRPKQWFCSREKSNKSLKYFFFFFLKKKNLPANLCRYDLKTVCRIFLKINVSQDTCFDYFKVPKIGFHNNINNKTRSTKNQENSVCRFNKVARI